MIGEKTRLILHVGQHKTGSKALQSFLRLNEAKLLEKGILYPAALMHGNKVPAYHISHFIFYVLARREAMIANGEVAAAESFWHQYGDGCKPFTGLHQLLLALEQERIKCNAHTIVISAEDLFDMQSAHELGFCPEWVTNVAATLVELTASLNWAPEVVVYLRRQDHLLNAHYAQYIKGSANNTLSFEVFARNFKPRLDSLGILELWSTALGRACMHVRPYEVQSLPNGIVWDFFEHVLGFMPGNEWKHVEKNLEYSNITPGRAYIDLMRAVNIFASKRWANRLRSFILKTAFLHNSTFDYNKGWLSPSSRKVLLKGCRTDIDQISQLYHGSDSKPFFKEPWPSEV